jgi:hypothetical protein
LRRRAGNGAPPMARSRQRRDACVLADEFLFTCTPSIRYTRLTILFINQAAKDSPPLSCLALRSINLKSVNLLTLRITNMKSLMIAIALVGTTATASAFAQSSPPAPQQPAAATQMAQNSSADVQQDGQWVPPDAQANTGKTRAQVYQELVHAEQDGELNYLNSTIYSH